MRYLEFLLEDYKTAKQKFLDAGADEQEIDQLFAVFKQKQNTIKNLNDKNIDNWPKRGFEKFKTFVTTELQAPTKSSLKKRVGDVLVLQDDRQWTILVPLDHDASCYYGKNTDWCTAKQNQNYFSDYFFNKEIILIYAINKVTDQKWAIAMHEKLSEMEFFTQQDKSISKQEYEKQTNLSVDSIVKQANQKLPYINQRREENKNQDIIYL